MWTRWITPFQQPISLLSLNINASDSLEFRYSLSPILTILVSINRIDSFVFNLGFDIFSSFCFSSCLNESIHLFVSSILEKSQSTTTTAAAATTNVSTTAAASFLVCKSVYNAYLLLRVLFCWIIICKCVCACFLFASCFFLHVLLTSAPCIETTNSI